MAEEQPKVEAAQEGGEQEQARLKGRLDQDYLGLPGEAGGDSSLILLAHAAQVIDPWSVSGGADGRIDYNKLLEQVGVV